MTATALVAAPAAALAATQSASAGIVTATFSYQGSIGPTISDEMLTIERSGQVLYSAPVTSTGCTSSTPCDPGSHQAVHVLGLEPGSEPDIVLDLFTGGANCCTVEQVFSYDPGTMTYVKSERDFSMAQAKLEPIGAGGRYEFVSSDASFQCAFTDCADSGAPLQIVSFADRRFTKVTSAYPKLIARDAAKWLTLYKHHLSDGLGLIAPWAADEDLLGRSAQVKSYLAAQVKAHHLKGQPLFPGGEKFIKALNRLLRKDGYVH
ncbi:MAG TPA: hypothetical protein VIJ20_08100 [Solirubrobacteraceae bacterium]